MFEAMHALKSFFSPVKTDIMIYLIEFPGKKTGGSKPPSKVTGDKDANINTHAESSPERDNKESNNDRRQDDSMEEYYQVVKILFFFQNIFISLPLPIRLFW